jgi:hypothetical protein
MREFLALIRKDKWRLQRVSHTKELAVLLGLSQLLSDTAT